MVPVERAYRTVDPTSSAMSRAGLDPELKSKMPHTVVRGAVISASIQGGFGRLIVWLLAWCLLVSPCNFCGQHSA